jgi:hypothetical protein
MLYFMYSETQRGLRDDGTDTFYKTPIGRIIFTEQNRTGHSAFTDAKVVGAFDDDKAPKISTTKAETLQRLDRFLNRQRLSGLEKH